MTAIPLAAGAALGAFAAFVLFWTGMARERSSGAVFLIAIALFWPVFAVDRGTSAEIMFHVAGFAAFTGVALAGYLRAAWLIGAGLLAHGVFDVLVDPGPAPGWWPSLCAGFDAVMGLACLWFYRAERGE